MGKPDFMMQTFIRCTQDALWDALTEADQMATYHFACSQVEGNAPVGNVSRFIRPDGSATLSQTTTKLEPKTRIEMTFDPHFFGPTAPSSRMVYVIEPQGSMCKLTVEHCDIAPEQESAAEGSARLKASLKS
jgi:uncharacterized protein YndB with AHSA1/START domain